MPDDVAILLHRLIGGDASATDEISARAGTTTTPSLLVVAALLTTDRGPLLARAAQHAVTTRDRQLVAVAAAHLDRDHDLFDALVRDHLAAYPDNVVAAWIAAEHANPCHVTR